VQNEQIYLQSVVKYCSGSIHMIFKLFLQFYTAMAVFLIDPDFMAYKYYYGSIFG